METRLEDSSETPTNSLQSESHTSSTSRNQSTNQNDNKKQLTQEELDKLKKKQAQKRAMRAIRAVQGLIIGGPKYNPQNPYPLHTVQTPAEAAKLIENGHSTTQYNNEGYMPLHTAQDLTILKVIIGDQFIFNLKTRDSKQTGVHTAKTAEIALFFLERGVSPFARDRDANTPFHTARDHTITEAIYNYLITKELSKDLSILNTLKNTGGKNPLHLARTPEQARFLIEHGMDPNIIDGNDEASLAALHDIQTAFVIIEAKKLQDAITGRNWERIERKLKEGVAVNKAFLNQTDAGGNTLLHLAAASDKQELVNVLIKAGVDVNIKNTLQRTALHYAQSPAVIKALIDAYANPDEQDEEGNTVLHSITSFDSTKALLEEEANPGKQNSEGNTPLHTITNLAIAKLLIQYGANPHIQNKSGETPLHVYIRTSEKLCNQIISLGRSSKGKSKLKIAQDMYRTLIEHFIKELKVDVNVYDKEENRPIHCTSELDIIELLVNAGAHINKRNIAGYTALTLAAIAYGNKDASQDKYKEIITYLLDKGAQVQPISPRSRKNSPHIISLTDSNHDYPDNAESDDEEKEAASAQEDISTQTQASDQANSTSTNKTPVPLLVLPNAPNTNNAPDTGRHVSARVAEILDLIQQHTPKSPQECYNCLRGFTLANIIGKAKK